MGFKPGRGFESRRPDHSNEVERKGARFCFEVSRSRGFEPATRGH